MEILIHRGGTLTTVQDLGRHGARAAGVPLSGAMDPLALRVANLLVGNSPDAAGVELTLLGPELEFSHDAVIAVTGADFLALEGWRPHRIAAGTRLRLGPAATGCRGYLAIAGGIQVPAVLGSFSTYLRGGVGGFSGRSLHEGDVLTVNPVVREIASHWRIANSIRPSYSAYPTLRLIAGAQAAEFDDAIFASEFTIGMDSDRMGLRLSGDALVRKSKVELPSAPVAPGTVQVPPDGQPILLMADAQTIGGYPQIGHVCSVDLPLAAQLRPRDKVRFAPVTIEVAQQEWLKQERSLALLVEGLSAKFR